MFTSLDFPFGKLKRIKTEGSYIMLRKSPPKSIGDLGISIGDIVYATKEELCLNKKEKEYILREYIEENFDYNYIKLSKLDLFSLVEILNKECKTIDCEEDIKNITESKYYNERLRVYTIYFPSFNEPIKLYEDEIFFFDDLMIEDLITDDVIIPITFYQKENKFYTLKDFPFYNNEEIRSIVENFILDGYSLNMAINEAIKIGIVEDEFYQNNLPKVFYKSKEELKKYFESTGLFKI